MSKRENPKVVVLCGGQGTRLREQTEFIPKPLVPVGGRPILWHIMKHYEGEGFRDFVVCLGYKGNMIKDYFKNYRAYTSDITVNTRSGNVHYEDSPREEWNVTLVDTGEDSQTGLRVGRVKRYLESEPYFLLTYGDGVGNVDISEVVSRHKKSEKVGTICATNPRSRYGLINVDDGGIATSFIEKPVLRDWTNIGYMVLNREFLDNPRLEENLMLEQIIAEMVDDGKIAVYKHEGFWASMDTQRDFEELNGLCKEGQPPWKTW